MCNKFPFKMVEEKRNRQYGNVVSRKRIESVGFYYSKDKKPRRRTRRSEPNSPYSLSLSSGSTSPEMHALLSNTSLNNGGIKKSGQDSTDYFKSNGYYKSTNNYKQCNETGFVPYVKSQNLYKFQKDNFSCASQPKFTNDCKSTSNSPPFHDAKSSPNNGHKSTSNKKILYSDFVDGFISDSTPVNHSSRKKRGKFQKDWYNFQHDSKYDVQNDFKCGYSKQGRYRSVSDSKILGGSNSARKCNTTKDMFLNQTRGSVSVPNSPELEMMKNMLPHTNDLNSPFPSSSFYFAASKFYTAPSPDELPSPPARFINELLRSHGLKTQSPIGDEPEILSSGTNNGESSVDLFFQQFAPKPTIDNSKLGSTGVEFFPEVKNPSCEECGLDHSELPALLKRYLELNAEDQSKTECPASSPQTGSVNEGKMSILCQTSPMSKHIFTSSSVCQEIEPDQLNLEKGVLDQIKPEANVQLDPVDQSNLEKNILGISEPKINHQLESTNRSSLEKRVLDIIKPESKHYDNNLTISMESFFKQYAESFRKPLQLDDVSKSEIQGPAVIPQKCSSSVDILEKQLRQALGITA